MTALTQDLSIDSEIAHVDVPLVAGEAYTIGDEVIRASHALIEEWDDVAGAGSGLRWFIERGEDHTTPAAHSSGATLTLARKYGGGGEAGEQTVYVQPTDPGAVGAGKLWVDTTEEVTGQRVQIRNDTDEAWFELFDGYRTPAEMSISTVDQQLRISRRTADGVSEIVEIRLEDTGGGLRIFTRDADGLQFNEFEISNDGYGADVKDEMGTIRAAHLGAAGGSGSSDAVWEWRIKDSGDLEKASFRLDETGIHFDGVVPEVPATPSEQDIVDALLALGLVTQAAP